MDKSDYLISNAIKGWLRNPLIRPGMRERILKQAANEAGHVLSTSYTPDHLQAWNLPGRKSGTANLWRFRFGAVLAPFHTGSMKLVM